MRQNIRLFSRIVSKEEFHMLSRVAIRSRNDEFMVNDEFLSHGSSRFRDFARPTVGLFAVDQRREVTAMEICEISIKQLHRVSVVFTGRDNVVRINPIRRNVPTSRVTAPM